MLLSNTRINTEAWVWPQHNLLMHRMTPFNAVNNVPCPLWGTFTLTEAPASLLFYVGGNPLPRSSLYPPQWLPSFCPLSCQMQMDENRDCVFDMLSLRKWRRIRSIKRCFLFLEQTLERKRGRLNTISQPPPSGSYLRLFLCRINENFSLFVLLKCTISLSCWAHVIYGACWPADWPGASGEGVCGHWPCRIFQWR